LGADGLPQAAWGLFGKAPSGWARVQAICDYVHRVITFDYEKASPTKSAFNAFEEDSGVCRDFAHLAVSLCRCMNIPARYCAGYLGDMGATPPMFPSATLLATIGWRDSEPGPKSWPILPWQREGEEDMTKAKARQRAKAKASQKVRKREAAADRPGPKIRPGQFDPGASSIKGPRVHANTKNFAGARRGAARSR